MPRGNVNNLKPFPKGVSGNPGGRSRKLKDLMQLCHEALDDGAFRQLVDCAKAGPDGPGGASAWQFAEKMLLEYGYGQPQPVELIERLEALEATNGES